MLNDPGRTSSDPAVAGVERRLYRAMRRIALDQLRGRALGGVDQLDLGATVLVHEAWLKLAYTGRWDSRAHFFGSAARAMRQVLTREGRRHQSRVKRDRAFAHGRRCWAEPEVALLDRAVGVDKALEQLEAEDPDLAGIAVMRLYADMPAALIAEELGVAKRTVERRWRYAAVRLRAMLDREATRS